ncbi:MAG TPA: threonylcarbamoyl-AMP synthase [Firmicutes bacterium]|nr:threonylcarbamoyl-AMP synthase [Bacillota bacterium]
MAQKTKVLKEKDLATAVRLLKAGQVVAFPTETVYGLGANAFDSAAVEKIFRAKGRPADNPLIVHIHSQEQLRDLVTAVPKKARALMDRFWPGPLTLVLPKQEAVPSIVTAGLATVGIRIPNHPLALRLLQKTGFPLAAPSANISGRPSPTHLEHVLTDLGGRIPAVLDGGEAVYGLESTVLDCTAEPFRLLRPGSALLEDLRQITPVEAGEGHAPPGPGLKYEHYTPNADVYLILGVGTPAKIEELSEHYRREGKKTAVMTWDERARLYPGQNIFPMGPKGNLQAVAANLYHLLRRADKQGIDVLFVEGIEEEQMGLTIMNRLRQAARGRVIQT